MTKKEETPLSIEPPQAEEKNEKQSPDEFVKKAKTAAKEKPRKTKKKVKKAPKPTPKDEPKEKTTISLSADINRRLILAVAQEKLKRKEKKQKFNKSVLVDEALLLWLKKYKY